MKKLICLVSVLLILLGCLSACNFTQRMSSSVGGAASSTPKVEEMMAALSENRTADAKALMHPQAAETADAAIAQMSDYMAGREIGSLDVKNININTSTGTSGKSTQEQVAYQVTFRDGAVIYLNVVYLTNGAGAGFASFQLVLGVV